MNKMQIKESDECQAFGCYAIGTKEVDMELDNVEMESDEHEVIQFLACESCAKKLSELKSSKLDNKPEETENRKDKYPKDRELHEYYEDEKRNLIKIPVEVQ